MVNIKFVLNDHFLIGYIIANYKRIHEFTSVEEEEKLVNFVNYAWKKNSHLTGALGDRGVCFAIPNLDDHKFNSIGKLLDDFIDELKGVDAYLVLKADTQKSLEKCETEWNQNYNSAQIYLKSLGIDTEGEFTIWLAHPALATGKVIGNNNILWSYRNEFQNYNAIYFWHEILHYYFRKIGINRVIEESIIQLIADNEMRKVLNGTDYPPFEGHEDTKALMEKIYPDWKEFLSQDKKDIKQFVEKISKKFVLDAN